MLREILKRIGITAVPTNALEVYEGSQEAEGERTGRVRVWVLVGSDVPEERVLPVREAFDPLQPSGEVRVMRLERNPRERYKHVDAVVVLAGTQIEEAAALATDAACRGVPVALVLGPDDDKPDMDLPFGAGAIVKVVRHRDKERTQKALARWLVRSSSGHTIALAANFAFCRQEAAAELTRGVALENALLGALSFIPGSHMPIMTANQARLALNIAAAHGRAPELARVPDMVAVVGAGLGYRLVGRVLVRVSPLGWVAQAAVGYGGTMATGTLMTSRIEAERPEAWDKAVRMAGAVRDKAQGLRDRVRDVADGNAGPSRDGLPAADEGYVVVETGAVA